MELLRYIYSRILRRFCTNYFKNININFAYNTSKLKDYIRYKDMLPNCMQSVVKYKFSCNGCNSTYVDTTIRHLRIRACEHKRISALTGTAIKTAFSSVHDHLLKTGHNTNLDVFHILIKSRDQSISTYLETYLYHETDL